MFSQILRFKNRLLILTVFSVLSCTSQENSHENAISEYPNQVGDIDHDPSKDDPGFLICDSLNVVQYYSLTEGYQYKGEKIALEKYLRANYTYKGQEHSGFFTVRFLVNCKGGTGRFRLFSKVDLDLEKTSLDSDLEKHLIQLSRQLDGWLPGMWRGKAVDYYQYLTFKIVNGRLVEISP